MCRSQRDDSRVDRSETDISGMKKWYHHECPRAALDQFSSTCTTATADGQSSRRKTLKTNCRAHTSGALQLSEFLCALPGESARRNSTFVLHADFAFVKQMIVIPPTRSQSMALSDPRLARSNPTSPRSYVPRNHS